MIYAPLYILSFPFLRPRHLSESEKFNIRYPNPELIPTTADRLRYYRYKKSLLQREVAEYAGIDEGTYISYENGDRDYFPKDKLVKIAELLEIDPEALLDEYNRFLWNGQGLQIHRLRKSIGMTQAALAKTCGVHSGTVKRWESGKIRVLKETWVRLFLSQRSTI